jgi:predicted RNase H-like nuclease (RuvC/YqgF family)
MADVTKAEMAMALVILLDLEDSDAKELEKMKAKTLGRIFEGYKRDALAYNNMYELAKKNKLI